MSDEQFDETINEASVAVQALVNALLFDRYGTTQVTAEARAQELKVVMAMLEAYTDITFVWGDLDFTVKKPYIPTGDV